MNKKDITLILIVAFLAITSLMVLNMTDSKLNKKAFIYYEDDIILTLDLNKNGNYEVDGYNGKVKLIVSNGKIKVDSEKSPLHLCSKQGFISKSYETIVCLPNKIIIKIENNDDIDTIVK